MQQVVTSGWANLSDGNVESSTGHFAVIHINPPELAELADAVFDGAEHTVKAGSFLLAEDSDGNATLYSYDSLDACMMDFNRLQAAYEKVWKTSVIAQDIKAMSNIFGPDTEVRVLSDDEARAIFGGES